MATTIDYAPRDERSWLRRHGRMVAIVIVAVAVAGAAYPVMKRVPAWLRWQRDWRAVAALPAGVDRPIEQPYASDEIARLLKNPPPPTRRAAAVQALAGSEGERFAVMTYGYPQDVPVFRMRRPDGQCRIVAISRPPFINRPFDGIDVAILREPWLFATGPACVAYQSQGMTGNGINPGGASEFRFDPATPSRLELRIGFQPANGGPTQAQTFTGELTDEDRLRWRLTACTPSFRGVLRLTPGEVFEFEDADGRLMTRVWETTTEAMLTTRPVP